MKKFIVLAMLAFCTSPSFGMEIDFDFNGKEEEDMTEPIEMPVEEELGSLSLIINISREVDADGAMAYKAREKRLLENPSDRAEDDIKRLKLEGFQEPSNSWQLARTVMWFDLQTNRSGELTPSTILYHYVQKFYTNNPVLYISNTILRDIEKLLRALCISGFNGNDEAMFAALTGARWSSNIRNLMIPELKEIVANRRQNNTLQEFKGALQKLKLTTLCVAIDAHEVHLNNS